MCLWKLRKGEISLLQLHGPRLRCLYPMISPFSLPLPSKWSFIRNLVSLRCYFEVLMIEQACSYSVLQNCLKLHHTQANNASHPAYTALAARRILTPCANCSIKYEAQVGDCICDSILRVRRYRGFGQRYCGSCFEAVMSFLLDVNNTRLHDGQEDNEFGCTKEVGMRL